jgi:hypothetical protein
VSEGADISLPTHAETRKFNIRASSKPSSTQSPSFRQGYAWYTFTGSLRRPFSSLQPCLQKQVPTLRSLKCDFSAFTIWVTIKVPHFTNQGEIEKDKRNQRRSKMSCTRNWITQGDDCYLGKGSGQNPSVCYEFRHCKSSLRNDVQWKPSLKTSLCLLEASKLTRLWLSS